MNEVVEPKHGKRGTMCRVPFGLVTVPLIRIMSCMLVMVYMITQYYEKKILDLQIAAEGKDKAVMRKATKGHEDPKAAGYLATLDDFIPFYGVFTTILVVHLFWALPLGIHHLRKGVRLMLQERDHGYYLDDHINNYLNGFGNLFCAVIISIFGSPPAYFVGIGAAVTCVVEGSGALYMNYVVRPMCASTQLVRHSEEYAPVQDIDEEMGRQPNLEDSLELKGMGVDVDHENETGFAY